MVWTWVLLATAAVPAAEANPEARTRVVILKRIFKNLCRGLETSNQEG